MHVASIGPVRLHRLLIVSVLPAAAAAGIEVYLVYKSALLLG
jgi:hypothetical protein